MIQWPDGQTLPFMLDGLSAQDINLLLGEIDVIQGTQAWGMLMMAVETRLNLNLGKQFNARAVARMDDTERTELVTDTRNLLGSRNFYGLKAQLLKKLPAAEVE